MSHGPAERSKVSSVEVAERLEIILPGLRRYATERGAQAHERRQAIWQRRHPDHARLGAPASWGNAMLDVDHVLEHAQRLGARVARVPVARLGTLIDDEVLFLSDANGCERLSRSCVGEVVASEVVPDGMVSGDALFVWVAMRRVIVVHHEGQVFDVMADAALDG